MPADSDDAHDHEHHHAVCVPRELSPPSVPSRRRSPVPLYIGCGLVAALVVAAVVALVVGYHQISAAIECDRHHDTIKCERWRERQRTDPDAYAIGARHVADEEAVCDRVHRLTHETVRQQTLAELGLRTAILVRHGMDAVAGSWMGWLQLTAAGVVALLLVYAVGTAARLARGRDPHEHDHDRVPHPSSTADALAKKTS